MKEYYYSKEYKYCNTDYNEVYTSFTIKKWFSFFFA